MTWCLGLDPSKRRTGWALFDTKALTIKSGSFPRFEGEDVEIYNAAFFALGRLLKHTVPKGETDRLFLLERPMYQIATRTVKSEGFGSYKAPAGNPKDQCILHGICSAFVSAATLMKFQPYETGMIMPAAWRKSFFGKGFKPRHNDKGEALWKKECVELLERQGIETNNQDEAEAAAIAYVLASHVRKFKQDSQVTLNI